MLVMATVLPVNITAPMCMPTDHVNRKCLSWSAESVHTNTRRDGHWPVWMLYSMDALRHHHETIPRHCLASLCNCK